MRGEKSLAAHSFPFSLTFLLGVGYGAYVFQS